jgi:hypothetical protein
MSVRGSGVGKEVYFNSSRALYAQRAGAARRGRTTHSLWQKVIAGNLASDVRAAQYTCGRPARTQQRSVRVRTGRVYGCGVLARGQ